MLTRCPHCDTHFRVTSQQIKARAGMVRCGACQAVFNALATLVDEPTSADGGRTAGAHYPPAEEDLVATTTLELDMVAALAADEATARQDSADNDFDFVDITAADEIPWQDDTTDISLAEQGPDAAAEASDAEIPATLPFDSEADTEPASFAESAAEPSTEPSMEPTTEPLPGTESELADYLAGPVVPAVEQYRRNWPWVLGSTVAVLMLLVQVTYYFRVDLGKLRPEWRQHLLAACKPFHCDVPRPRDIDTIGIDSSDLRPDPQQPGRLTLKALLRSQAAYAQEWPLLELTLTDVNDQKIAVRHFPASEYLPKDNKLAQTLAAGFPTKGEIAVSLPLDVGYLAAAGYRLYVFYP